MKITKSLIVIISVLILSTLFLGGCTKNSEVDNYEVTKIKTNCDEIACFDRSFIDCKPATLTLTIMDTIVYHHEIIGLEGDLCVVRSKYLKNPNPEWVGVEMTCKYDHTIGFNKAYQDTSTCEGPLRDLITL